MELRSRILLFPHNIRRMFSSKQQKIANAAIKNEYRVPNSATIMARSNSKAAKNAIAAMEQLTSNEKLALGTINEQKAEASKRNANKTLKVTKEHYNANERKMWKYHPYLMMGKEAQKRREMEGNRRNTKKNKNYLSMSSPMAVTTYAMGGKRLKTRPSSKKNMVTRKIRKH